MWSKGVSKNLDSNIENPGVSFVGMTQLSTFLPRGYHKMTESGGLFDRTLMVVNPGPARLFPEVQAEKVKELEKYREKDLK